MPQELTLPGQQPMGLPGLDMPTILQLLQGAQAANAQGGGAMSPLNGGVVPPAMRMADRETNYPTSLLGPNSMGGQNLISPVVPLRFIGGNHPVAPWNVIRDQSADELRNNLMAAMAMLPYSEGGMPRNAAAGGNTMLSLLSALDEPSHLGNG